MFRTILKSLVAVVACVVLLGASSTLFAHGGHGGHGGHGYRHYPTYHNTGHYDYHRSSYQRHGNHYHYVPGHYDYHQTGHYHW